MTSFGLSSTASARTEGMGGFGSPERLVDAGGAVVQEWTVTDLKTSTDTAPGYPLAGQLWEATVTVAAVSGTVTPIIPNLRATTMGGDSYQALWQVASPQGLSGATLPQGQTSTGKVYFDVTGADPHMVTYTGSGTQRLMWCLCESMMPGMMEMPG
ncbi:MPT63 family protein [Mycobacterium barrassiae]|jgi:hypothetical protein|nr:MPT63 family protein [Mycobacterium barrassiae]MCV7303526.1 MPT63 family protein [Mycobacterium barrassiae]